MTDPAAPNPRVNADHPPVGRGERLLGIVTDDRVAWSTTDVSSATAGAPMEIWVPLPGEQGVDAEGTLQMYVADTFCPIG